jgi:PAS domain S-box-containing protein
MSGFDSIGRTGGMGDPRLMAHALSATPAWVWSADGARILWANAPGAAIFKTSSPDGIAELRFEADDASAAQIIRLAETLPATGVWRLERLRGFGAAVGGTLTCQCIRIELGGESAILVVSGERAGPDISFETRLRSLVAGSKTPAAAFSAGGRLLEASSEATARLGARTQLDHIGAAELAQKAIAEGHAEGDTAIGNVAIDRLSAGDSTILFMTLREAAPAATPTESVTAVPIVTINETQAPATAEPPATASSPARPLRFVWQMDQEQRFTIQSTEFEQLLGPQVTSLLGQPWPQIAGTLDPEGKVAPLLAQNETWNGVTLRWPIDGETIAVEMSGLPVFGVGREIDGYRGFGVCRDRQRLHELAARRDQAAVKPEQPPAIVAAPTEEAPPAEHSATVVPFPTPERPPALDPKEAIAFDQLARELSDRLKKPVVDDDFGDERHEPISTENVPPPAAAMPDQTPASARIVDSESELPIIDRLPVGILIYRLNDLVYANRAFLEWTGYSSLMALRDAGGLDSLFIESTPGAPQGNGNGGKTLTITTPTGKQMPVQGRLFSTQWAGDSALVLMLNTMAAPEPSKSDEAKVQGIETENRELKAVLNTATDGILLFDRSQRILSANYGAESLFGMEESEFAEVTFGDLFSPESKKLVLEYFDRIAGGGSASLINEGLQVTARVRRGGLIPLHMSLGHIEGGEKFCAIFRDMTAWKRTEDDLVSARRQAETASAAKSDFLAKISHEIRIPLNAIIGFSDVMMEERFGPIGNDRYRDYLRDIHTSGGHLISLLNELLDLSKIEAGKLDLTFASVNLNDLTQQCVAIMQQQANRERVILRSSLTPNLPQIVADARSVRQIVLNLLSNAIKFTGAGSQVIVSTALTDAQEVVLRVRDTGEGMSDQELKAALEPFRQLATASRWGSSGTGLGLPITKALTEANHATFKISSALHDGTLVEIAFPATRVLA